MLLIYETADDFNSRSNEQPSALMGAWRAYYRALVDAGVYVGGAPLEAPATGATVRVHGGERRVQDGRHRHRRSSSAAKSSSSWRRSTKPSTGRRAARRQRAARSRSGRCRRWSTISSSGEMADDPRGVVEHVARESLGGSSHSLGAHARRRGSRRCTCGRLPDGAQDLAARRRADEAEAWSLTTARRRRSTGTARTRARRCGATIRLRCGRLRPWTNAPSPTSG